MSRDKIEVEGKVIAEYRGDFFDIQLGNEAIVRARRSGRMNLHKIKVVVGDSVIVELSPYDLTKGRITYRL